MQKALQKDMELFPWEALPPGKAALVVSGGARGLAPTEGTKGTGQLSRASQRCARDASRSCGCCR